MALQRTLAMMRRYTVHFSGRVQGVGFRDTARRVARDFDVTGFVQNLPDGRVLLVAEGEEPELERYLAALERRMQGYIQSRTIDRSEGSGEFGQAGVDPLVVRH